MDPKRVVVHHLPIKPQPQFPPPPPPQHSSSSTSFPILALSILGILTTSILLLSYYIFVIKCCLNWRHSDVISRLSRSRMHRRRRRPHDYPLSAYSAAVESRGLGESAIRSIPTFRYRKGGGNSTTTTAERRSFNECAVCLNEFQEGERIRLLPNCLHLFHIDCIDTWLQSNANCPLCRSPITAINPVLAAQFTEPGNAHNPNQHDDTVIEVISSSESHEQNHPQVVASPRKGEELVGLIKKGKRLHSVSSMGDECIEMRSKDDNFCIQTMRRSFSMDSSSDKQLYLALQGILQKNPQLQEICSGGESSSPGEGDGPSSRSAITGARGELFCQFKMMILMVNYVEIGGVRV